MIRSFGPDEILFLISSAGMTIILSIYASLFGALIGLAVAIARLSKITLIHQAASAYISVVQGIPVLILLFIAYFGLSQAALELPPVVAASLSLSLYVGAYLGDIWRGAIASVPVQQWEASASLALTPVQQYRWVILPQAVRISLPPTVGFLVQLIKNTSIVSIVSVTELARAGQLTNNATFQPFPVFLTVAAIYFVICFPLSWTSRKLEMRFHVSRPG